MASWPGSLARRMPIPSSQNVTREIIGSYVVEAGDSVFSIAKQYDIKPETILWANEDLLQDNPNDLSIGQN